MKPTKKSGTNCTLIMAHMLNIKWKQRDIMKKYPVNKKLKVPSVKVKKIE